MPDTSRPACSCHGEPMHKKGIVAGRQRWRCAVKARRQAREYMVGWRERNPDRIREYDRQYYWDNRDAALKASIAWQKANPEWVRAKNQRRRAELVNAHREPYETHDVFERDGWICQICEQVVLGSTSWPDPKSPSIDHIVPLSLGGADAPFNVQLAHLGCNSAKGNVLFPSIGS